MSEEQAANLVDTTSEVIDAQSNEAEHQSDDENSGEAGGELADNQQTPIEDDTEEVEYEGKKHRVARELKEALMRHVDYTRKTMEVAEQRKTLESRAEAIEQQAKAQQTYIHEYATLVAVENQVKQYDQVDWQKWSATDPQGAQAAWFERTRLLETRSTLANEINQKETQRLREQDGKKLETQQSNAKQIKECFDVVARDIKGWSPELAKSLDKTAYEFGFTNEELGQIKDPRFVKLLHKAHIAEQLLKKQTSPNPKVDAKPVPQVGGGSAAVKQDMASLAKTDPSKWMKLRNEELRRKK